MTNILHTEVGGTYGGSTRALELLLAHSDRRRFNHDVLFYYPTPGSERLKAHARRVWTLFDASPRVAADGARKRRPSMERLAGILGPLHPWLRAPSEIRTARRIVAAVKHLDYDLVNVNNTFYYQPAALLAARLLDLPVVSHQRSVVADSWMNRALARFTDCIVSINADCCRTLESWRAGIPIETCHDAAECPAPDGAAVAQFRRALVPTGGMLIGSIGRLERVKGLDDLLRAARLVVDVDPKARFVIAGDGPERDALETLAVRLGLRDKVTFCGFRPDFANVLAALDVFVCSSRWEGGPLTLIEAALLRTPVVTTKVGIAEELIPRGEGELVTPGDIQAMARSIAGALAENSLERRRVDSLRDRALALTNPVATTRQLEAIFLKMLAARLQRRRRVWRPAPTSD